MQKEMINEVFYTVENLATLLNSHPVRVRTLINQGKLKAFKKIGKWYIFHSDVCEFIKTPNESESENENESESENDNSY